MEWQPIIGILPPLSEADWSLLFDKYQTSPEYHKMNMGMTLKEFKGIFWLEYIHRVWGRLLSWSHLIDSAVDVIYLCVPS